MKEPMKEQWAVFTETFYVNGVETTQRLTIRTNQQPIKLVIAQRYYSSPVFNSADKFSDRIEIFNFSRLTCWFDTYKEAVKFMDDTFL